MKRPSIKTPCIADRYHMPQERIAEVTFPDGSGCLLSCRMTAEGPVIDVYRADPSIRVLTPRKGAWEFHPDRVQLDNRHTIAREHTGRVEAQWVFRFCGDFISAHPTRRAAKDSAAQWELARIGKES